MEGHCSAAAQSAVPGPLPRSSIVAGCQPGIRAAVACIAPRNWAYAAGKIMAAYPSAAALPRANADSVPCVRPCIGR